MAHQGAAGQKVLAAAVRQGQQHALHKAAVMVTGGQEPGKTGGQAPDRLGPHHVPDGLPGKAQGAAVGQMEQTGAVPVQRVLFPGTVIDPPALSARLVPSAPAVQACQHPHQQTGRTAGEAFQHDGTAADDVPAHGLQDLQGAAGGAAQGAEKLPDPLLAAGGKTGTERSGSAPVAPCGPAFQQARGLRAQDDAVTVDTPLPKGICSIHDMRFEPVGRQRYITHRVHPGIICYFLSKAYRGGKPFPPGLPRV